MEDLLLSAARSLIAAGGEASRLGALLLLHASLESRLNRLGEAVAPEAWRDERAFFTRTPHRGTLGKLNYLWERAYGTPPDWGRRPHQSLKELDAWRNRLAHGGRGDGAGPELPDLERLADDVAAVGALLDGKLPG